MSQLPIVSLQYFHYFSQIYRVYKNYSNFGVLSLMSLLINLQKSFFYSQKDKALAFDSYHLILVKFEEKLSKYKLNVWSKKNLEEDFKCTAL